MKFPTHRYNSSPTPEEEEALINHSWGCVEQVINIRKENGQIFKNFFTKEV
jgi:hypothetical protein